MDRDKKEVIYQIFIISSLILLSFLVMYFSYKQSRKRYYDGNGNPNKEMQEMFGNKDASRVL